MIDIDLLKSYFENDDQPDEDQFAALLEACFNANGGWVEVPDGTASYSSATQMLFTDADLFIGVGDQVRYKQGAGYKFGLVTAVSETTVDLDGGAGFALTNSTITAMAFAKAGGVGFPEALKYLTAWPAGLGRYANTETLSANKALVDADNPIQFLDPSASVYTVTLPAEGENNHPFYLINTSGSYDLQVDDDGEVTIVTVEPGLAALVISDGTQWALAAGNVDPDNVVTLDGTQTIDGAKSFVNPLTVPSATGTAHAINKGQGDDLYALKEQVVAASVEVFQLRTGDHEDVETGDGKASIPIPEKLHGWSVSRVWARVGSAPSGGTALIQIYNAAIPGDLLSTRISINAGTLSSDLAGTQPVINSSNAGVQMNKDLRIDVDAAYGAAGLIVVVEFTGDLD